MASLDAEWNEVGDVIAETAAGCPILWQCLISVHNGRNIWADYEETANQRIERGLLSKMQTVTLPEPFENWRIDFKNMMQTNVQKGTTRPVRRTVVVAT